MLMRQEHTPEVSTGQNKDRDIEVAAVAVQSRCAEDLSLSDLNDCNLLTKRFRKTSE